MRYLTNILLASSLLSGVGVQAATEINYWLWDNNQLPSYQACAAAFEKKNPDIKIKITQTGWFDYWTALSAAFVSGTAPDRQNVMQYGLLLNGQSDGLGHEEWANFAASLGWNYCAGPWATQFNYDDPKLIDTVRWFADMSLKKDFIVPAKDARQAAATGLFAGQKGALALTGSWLVHWYTENCEFDIGFAPLPKGPQGRKTVINGLADSIWVGSKHQEEAWKWVKFLASPEAQKIVGGYGVVFPAIADAAEISMKRMAEKGADVSAFVDEAKQPDGTFFLPISEHASDVVRILRANFDAIFLEGADVMVTLKATNKEVNALFE